MDGFACHGNNSAGRGKSQRIPATAGFPPRPIFPVVVAAGMLHQSPAMSETPRPPSRQTAAGRWFLAFIGLFVALVGALFVFLMARSFLRALDMRQWPETECTVLVSEVAERKHDEQSPAEYRHRISFGYEWNGEALTSDQLTLRGSPWSSKRDKIEKSVAEFPAGQPSTCRVNPDSPETAILRPDSLAPGYSIWFPGLFVVGGLVMAFRALIRSSSR